MLFGGGYTDVRGNIIKKYNPIDHDGFGAIASPLNPKAELGCSTTDGFSNVTESFADQTLAIYGGGTDVASNPTNTQLLRYEYFKFFPLYAYKFLATDTLTLSASMIYSSMAGGNFYVAVMNHANAATDAGKFGLYECSANDGFKITVADKFIATDTTKGDAWGSATAGLPGSPAWSATLHTNTHDAGTATVYLVNSSGTPIGHTLFLGKAAARRGYGKYRNNRTEDSHEGGFVKDIFVTSVFGQEPCEDAAGRMPGYLVITHAVQYAGVDFPAVSLT